MVIDNDLLKNKTALSLKVNKAVVAEIKKSENNQIKTEDLINAACASVGLTEKLFASKENRGRVLDAVKACLNVLEEVGAIAPQTCIKQNFTEYLLKKQGKITTTHINGKSNLFSVAEDFSKKVSAIKANEQIVRSDVVTVDLGEDQVSILAVKDVDYQRVKFCNSMFNYTRFADYIGVMRGSKVDLISTADEKKYFFSTPDNRTLPQHKQIMKLYYIVNMSEYKTLFKSDANNNPVQTMLSLKKCNNQLTTENLKVVSGVKKASIYSKLPAESVGITALA